MIKVVILDLDNTLVDFMKLKHVSCEAAVSAMIDAGLDMSKQKALKILFELYDKYGIEYKQIFQKFLTKTNGRVDWKILSSGIVAYRRVKNGFIETYPGVKPTLMQLKSRGIKLGILTDAPKMNAYIRLAALQILDFFDEVLTFDDTKKYKPHKKPFLMMLKRFDVKPEEALMVGDWPARDIKGAGKVGLKTCFAKYGGIFREKTHLADYEISKFRELLDIV